jgi:3-oxoadipyl-CoA thiolase
MEEAFLADAVRTPIGRYGGALKSVRPDDLLAGVIRALVERNPSLDPAAIEDVIAGDANQAGEDNRNVARMAALLAGLPVTVPGTTVNRLCASGMQAVMDAARGVMCGDGDLYLAGGVESMTRAPWVMAKAEGAYQRAPEIHDSTIGWRFINPALVSRYPPYSMGETAEKVARDWHVTREQQDRFAVGSMEKYYQALEKGLWEDEIAAVELSPNRQGKKIFNRDEHPRPTTLEMLSSLRPAFVKGGTVTAGNSSGLNDGAAALVVASAAGLRASGMRPLARVVSMAVTGVDPSLMGTGPVSATEKALKRAGIAVGDLDLVELSEAFASTSIACIRDLGLDPARVNVNGGNLALGNPMGCCGARILTTLVHEMKRRPGIRYCLATTSVGIGQGAAMVLERL